MNGLFTFTKVSIRSFFQTFIQSERGPREINLSNCIAVARNMSTGLRYVQDFRFFLFNWPIFRRLLQFGPGRQWPPTETKILQAWCPSCHKAVSKHWSDAHTHIVSNYFILFIYFIRSTSKSRPNNIKRGKCPPVRTSVRPSTKSFFDLNEISCVGRGR